MTSGPSQEPEPEPDEPRSKRTAPKLTVANIGGGVLAAVGALAAGAQLLDYIQSGKFNLIASAFFAGVAALGIAGLLARKDRKAVTIGAAGAVLVVTAAFAAVALARVSSSASPNGPIVTATPTAPSPQPSSPLSPTASSTPRQPLCPTPTGPVTELKDDFEDGRVDTCKWDVEETVTNVYHDQPGIRVYEQEGLLIFDVPEPLQAGDDVEIFALPIDKAIQEVSADIILFTSGAIGSPGGSTGIAANFGAGGPLVALDGGPGADGAGNDISLCPFDGADYDKCSHPEPCGSLDLRTGTPVKLRIVRTASGVDTYIGGIPCGPYTTDRDMTSVNLNLYAADGSTFRMAIDNFYMRYEA